MLKIKELPVGMIIWKKRTILGITGATLPNEYYDFYCNKIPGNDFDYELVEIIEKEKIISIIQDCGVKMKEFCETTRRIWKLIEEYPIEKEEEKEIEPLAKLGNYKVNTGDDFLDKVLTNINERINHLIDKQTELIDAVNGIRKEK